MVEGAEGDGFFEGFLEEYFVECDEHLAAMSRALLTLEAAIGQPHLERAVIDELFRLFHSVKGISAMVALREAEQLAHSVEHYLRAVRDRELLVSVQGVEILIEGTQRLEQIITAQRFGRPLPRIDDLEIRIADLANGSGAHSQVGSPSKRVEDANETAAGQPATRQWVCTFSPTRDLLASGVGVDAVRKRLMEVGTIVHTAPQILLDGTIAFQFTLDVDSAVDVTERLRGEPVGVEAVEQTPGLVANPPASESAPLAPAGPSHVVRVDMARLDALMRGVGDLVISRARLADSLAKLERKVPQAEWRSVQDNIAVLDRQLKTLRQGIMRVRLVPVSEIFRRMPFVVRDLARDAGKSVALEVFGQSTEIDKYVIERMMDPVLHLVRNAVSHGIETSEARLAAGKRAEGVITLSAAAAGELVAIEIADDGRGIDIAAVTARARAMGLQVTDDTPSPTELLTWLCTPGFSTTDRIDRASGRGVGMAVVKDTVEQLSGSMSLETTAGVGTRFVIQLPLTLAIADALIGRVGTESFAIPQNAVREVIEIATADVRTLEGNEIVPYRGGALPLIRLARLFGIASAATGRLHAFVVGSGRGALGLVVDRIVGQREIVVRTVSDPLVRVDGISGATDLGDGRVVLILDPATLSRLTAQRAARVLGDAAGWGRLGA